MSLQDALRAEIDRRQNGGGRRVFSIFNIGTNHRQNEPNNTIAALGNSCIGTQGLTKYVNDGPTGAMGNFQGWGMNDFARDTQAAIRAARPTHVVMTGHSRGAILCHMLAHEIFKDPATRNIKISMMVLDPVHQSKIAHAGAEALDDNPNLLSYHSIIMTHEDTKVIGGALFPYKFLLASDAVTERMHYIPMPGKHGSGSQNLTSPIGKAVYHLIANFMRARGTDFDFPVPEPIDMCEYFAAIHALNPASVDGAKRLVFDDGGFTTTHVTNKKTEGYHTEAMRAADVKTALQRNTKFVQRPGQRHLPVKPVTQYFFNQEHAFYFKAAFPYFFKMLAGAVNARSIDHGALDRDFARLSTRPMLTQTFALLAAQLNSSIG